MTHRQFKRLTRRHDRALMLLDKARVQLKLEQGRVVLYQFISVLLFITGVLAWIIYRTT